MRLETVLAAALLTLAPAAASAEEAAVTLPGSPLSVSVGPLGQCQSSYTGLGNDFYPPSGALGDCGFFLGFPESGNPSALQKKVYGFEGVRGPRLASRYTPVGRSAPTGTGAHADPYEQVTRFKVDDPTKPSEGDYALVEETTSYVDGEAQFTSTFDVENVTGQSIAGLSPAPATNLRFHAIYAGDLMTGGGELGTGVLAGPPRLVGAQNETLGVLGGLAEAPSPSPPWTNYEAGCWNAVPEPAGRCPATSLADGGIWAAVADASAEAPVFDDVVDPSPIDDGVGVSWDDHIDSPLKPGEHAVYSIVNRADIPARLSVAPAAQTFTVGQTAAVSVVATDNAGLPYSNRPIVYTIGSTNPKGGSVLTNQAGVATISYTGTVAGPDTIEAFLDLAGSGQSAPRDPVGAAVVTWTMPARTLANSAFALRSLHVGRDGVITVELVPTQDGTATIAVTVPTAAIARNPSVAKRRKCKRGELALDGRCRPKTSRSGKITANGKAGRTLKLTVGPSAAVRRALAEGRSVKLTAKLVYRSKLGGAPAVRTFHMTVAQSRKRRSHH